MNTEIKIYGRRAEFKLIDSIIHDECVDQDHYIAPETHRILAKIGSRELEFALQKGIDGEYSVPFGHECHSRTMQEQNLAHRIFYGNENRLAEIVGVLE